MVEEAGILEKQISDKDVALTAVNDNRVAAELELQTAQRKLAEITSKRADAQTHADVIEWVRTAQPRYQHLLNQQREVNEELSRATAVLAQHRTPKRTPPQTYALMKIFQNKQGKELRRSAQNSSHYKLWPKMRS